MANHMLNEAERTALISTLGSRGALRPCELCAHKEWELGSYLVTPVPLARSETRSSMDLGGRLHGSALLLCVNCGNTKFLNIGILGLQALLPQADPTRPVRF